MIPGFFELPVSKGFFTAIKTAANNISAFFPALRSGQNQPLSGSGHCHIKNPHFFSESNRLFLLSYNLIGKRIQFTIGFPVNNLQTNGIIKISETIAVNIFRIKIGLKFRKENNRKFKPFTFMNADNPNSIFRCTVGLSRSPVLLGFLQFFNKLNKSAERRRCGNCCKTFKLNRPFVQLQEIGFSHLAIRHCENKSHKICFSVNSPEQISQTRSPRKRSPILDSRKYRFDFFS